MLKVTPDLNMLTVVVILNVLISLLCFYAAWRIWKLRRALAIAADAISSAERNTHKVLNGAPTAIERGQSGVGGLRERYQQLEIQWQRVEQVLTLLVVLQRIWRLAWKSSIRRSHSRRSRYVQRPSKG
ncbi:MAG TPA: hypothetical protein DDZ80_28100 [Cyanobacteria bacterium UBA8803]|nr:hypothetical protein [Cyanobacteria bacterium UBA9273]HBL62126.1 hypothetical protein [Cyanobacteria bacterium UBA8803]